MLQNLFSLLPFLVSLFWLTIFLVEFGRLDPAKKLLTGFMVLCTILYFCHAVYYHQHIHLYSLVESIYTFCTLAVYPLYYLYIRRLTSEKPLVFHDYWVLLPALIISLVSVLLYSLMSESERLTFVERFFFNQDTSVVGSSLIIRGQIIRIHIAKFLFIAQLLPVSYFGYRLLLNFSKQVNNYYSDTQKKTLSSTRMMLSLFILFAFFSAIANQLGRNFFLQESWLIVIPSIIFSSMIFAVCYVGLKQNFTAEDFHLETRTAQKVETENPYSNTEILIDKIRVLMEEDQLFRKMDLHISDVALSVGSNRTYVSTYINKELNMSFSDYINNYRIEYAKSLLSKQNNTLSLIEISEQSGFTNEVSFYRNFKKFTGTTPNRWLHEHASEC